MLGEKFDCVFGGVSEGGGLSAGSRRDLSERMVLRRGLEVGAEKRERSNALGFR